MAFTRNTEAGAAPATMPATTTAGAPAFRRAAAQTQQAMTVAPGADIFSFVSGGEDITITLEDIRNYFCPKATDKECVMFGQLCKANGLNPWLREAYLIKYDEKAPAAMVTGKDAYMKRANEHPQFDGLEAGVKVFVPEAGQIEYREGAAYYPDLGEQLIGGWAKVYRKDRSRPSYEEVSLKEYDKGQSKWKEAPATMIRKVALVHALREAFPTNIQGMYDADETPYEADVEGSFQDVSNRPRPGEALRAHQQRAKALREAASAAKAPQESDDPFAIPADAIEEDGDPA